MLYTPEYTASHELEDYFQHERRVTSIGEQFEAEMKESFVRTIPGMASIEGEIARKEKEAYGYSAADIEAAQFDSFGYLGPSYGKEIPLLSEEEFKASSDYRKGFKWDERMTPVRLSVMAKEFDKHKERESLINRAPDTMGRKILGFGAGLVGSLPDPLNFVGFGELKAGATLGKVLLRGAAEGAVGNALADAVAVPYLNDMGYDIGAQEVMSDIAFGAILGGGLPVAARGVKSGIDTLRYKTSLPERKAVEQIQVRAMDELNEGRVPELNAQDLDVIHGVLGKTFTPAEADEIVEGFRPREFDFKQFQETLVPEEIKIANTLTEVEDLYQVGDKHNIQYVTKTERTPEGEFKTVSVAEKVFVEADERTERFGNILSDVINECF